MHFYQHGGFSPGNSTGGELQRVISQETGVTPDKPFAITETGFNDLPVQYTGYFGTPAINARYVLNLTLDAFQAGSRLTVLYELFDEHIGPTGKSAFKNTRSEVRVYDPVVSKNPVQVLRDVRRVAVNLADCALVVDPYRQPFGLTDMRAGLVGRLASAP